MSESAPRDARGRFLPNDGTRIRFDKVYELVNMEACYRILYPGVMAPELEEPARRAIAQARKNARWRVATSMLAWALERRYHYGTPTADRVVDAARDGAAAP